MSEQANPTYSYNVIVIGLGNIPWILNAELFQPEAKSLCSSIGFCFNWLCAFLVTKFGPELEFVIGASGAYFFFGALGIASEKVNSCQYLKSKSN